MKKLNIHDLLVLTVDPEREEIMINQILMESSEKLKRIFYFYTKVTLTPNPNPNPNPNSIFITKDDLTLTLTLTLILTLTKDDLTMTRIQWAKFTKDCKV